MSEKNAVPYTVLHLRFKLRVPPTVILGKSREAAAAIASIDGLIWKIWISDEESCELGGVYLFATRKSAEAYMNHPIIRAIRSNPAVVSEQFQLWEVESSLSALTRAPLPGVSVLNSQPELVHAGGQ